MASLVPYDESFEEVNVTPIAQSPGCYDVVDTPKLLQRGVRVTALDINSAEHARYSKAAAAAEEADYADFCLKQGNSNPFDFQGMSQFPEDVELNAVNKIIDDCLKEDKQMHEYFAEHDSLNLSDVMDSVVMGEPQPTNEEVLLDFITSIVCPEIEAVLNWGDIQDVKEKAVFKKTCKVIEEFFMENGWCSELAEHSFKGCKYVVDLQKVNVMVHAIYPGLPCTDLGPTNDTIVTADHVSTKDTSRCGNSKWHTHHLYAGKVKSAGPDRFQLIEDIRSFRSRAFRHQRKLFRVECQECRQLSSSAERSRKLACTTCGRTIKHLVKWDLQAIINCVRYVVRRKLEGVIQRKDLFRGTAESINKRLNKINYPRTKAASYFKEKSSSKCASKVSGSTPQVIDPQR